jgi:hypothetical protein
VITSISVLRDQLGLVVDLLSTAGTTIRLDDITENRTDLKRHLKHSTFLSQADLRTQILAALDVCAIRTVWRPRTALSTAVVRVA